jgi:hypothetical protein
MVAYIQIPNLPVAIALGGSEQLEAVQAGTSVRITVAQLQTYFNLTLAVGGTGIYGGSTGNFLYDNGGFLGELPFGIATSKTANYTILAADNYRDFDNNGAAGQVTFTLPAATVGLAYGFAVMEAQNLVIDAPGGVTIYLGELATSAGGTITANTIGSYLFIKCRSDTEWLAQSSMGTWTPA